MKSFNLYRLWRTPGIGRLAALLWLAAVLGGCAASYGSFQNEPAIARQFESGAPPGGYAYYWYGHDNHFYAIAGLDPRLAVHSRLWRKIEPGSEEFQRAVAWIWEDYGFRRYGAHILDGQGRRVGVWFSAMRYPSVKFIGDQGIDIIPDMPFMWGPAASGGPGIQTPSG
jgi:hypothetical protein